jgi:hypothetical protein
MLNITSKWRDSLTAVAIIVLVAGCSRKPSNEQSAGGAIDTAVVRTGSSAVTPAVGPAVQVTRTDARSVTKAMDLELTPDNFTKFLAAADSIGALDSRNAATHAYLGTNITDAGSTDVDAGLKWLESNDSVSKAITSAGISVRDYFVTSLATAAAARFIDDPKAAPGTPALAKNAEFLRSRKSELAHLQTLRDRRPVVTANP